MPGISGRAMFAAMSAPLASTSRIASIDLIRGAVMVLMAIDHVRVYSGLPAGGPTPGIFFTRWVTHFVAPAFIFLAGTSAFFYGRKHTDLSRFLFVRGVWLVLLELTVIRVCWTFNLDFANYMLAGVIWVIGWCMILMSALVRLRPRTAGIIGVAIIALHNLVMMPLVNRTQALGELWKILYIGFFQGPVAGTPLIVLYSIIPWIGVMAAGYWFGTVLTTEPARRYRICLSLGLGATALFLALRGLNIYGDPQPWSSSGRMPALLSFLNTTKYPASLSFLLMTLGPTIALVPLLDRARGRVAQGLTVFGRVPFFYYVLHIPLIHALALVVSKLRTGSVDEWLFTNHPMGNPPAPDGYTWSLALLYLVWAVAIVILYVPSRWYSDLKARRTDLRWLRFI
ncbi:MAG TPA: heparan-alpha-glucosaminide N-acetyltransferase domain-containing protein [Gemmatimonadales bacterium]|nr:heparan-alpha-glucosaminide N-acetyltransferase domain-containing protein [Gemmatimonadales bacterium]